MASIVNKIKDAVHPHHHSSSTTHSTTSQPEGTSGPHNSRVANAADPRVDSDRDHRAAPGSTMGSGNGLTSSTNNYTYGTSGATGNRTTGYDDPEGVHGPHKSRMANAADPRVDSDRDHRAAPGSNAFGNGASTGMSTGGMTTGTGTGTGAGLGRTTGVTGGVSTGGPGPAPHTAGPHKSDAMNKVDPRVDSDMDGSYKLGGNSNTNTYRANKDPRDAAQVPPSVFQKHNGPPTIHHDDHAHGRERRHSVTTHQEQYRGI